MNRNKKRLTESVSEVIAEYSENSSEGLDSDNDDRLHYHINCDSLSDDTWKTANNDAQSSSEAEDDDNESKISEEGQSNVWNKVLKDMNRCTFIGKSGLQKEISKSNQNGSSVCPIDIFLTFVNDEVLQLMTTETNRYANQVITAKPLTRSSRLHLWKETNILEMKKFLGIIMFMGVVNFPKIECYWKKSAIYFHPILHKVGMSYNRFSLLLKFWHFTDNSNTSAYNSSRVYKVQPLIDLVFSNIRQTYIPGDTVVIDECVIPFRETLNRKSSSLSKHGIKIYKLCTPKGFVYSFSIYCGPDLQIPTLDKLGSVVVNLGADLLNEGRLFITNKLYTSIPLATYLKERKSDLCGALRKSRKYIPKDVLAAKLRKKGEYISRQSCNAMILKWHDKRDVLMLSTCHDDKIVCTGKNDRQGQLVFKPHAITAYDAAKRVIDAFNQMSICYYSPVRNSVVWYKKVAIELLFGSVVTNSWIIYNEIIEEKCTLLQFTEKLIDSLILLEVRIAELCPSNTHFMSKIPRKEDGKIVRKRCSECYKELRAQSGTQVAAKRCKQVDTECLACSKAFCVKCFAIFHKEK